MRLLNFSVGRSRPQLIDGEEVRTAYVKRPVPQPWVITATGPAANEVAVHTDHLYVFDRESYEYWSAELGARRDSWPDGTFAENLTLDSIDQSQLRIGERYRLGSATLVVTGPRVPCWKLTWALGQPKSFMRRFRLSGHSGAYFGVIEPGVVAPGDELVLVGGDESAPSVAALSELCDSGTQITHDQRGVIDRALASEDLSLTVRATLKLKLAGLERDARSSVGAWRGWRQFEIESSENETADSASFHLRPRDGGALPGFRAGQHVVVRLAENGEKPVVRTWSLSSFARVPDRYRITVRLRQSGRGSAILAEAVAAGTLSELTVELRTPGGQFQLDRGAFRPIVLVAAGIGITPMISMIQAHLERGSEMPPLWLLYGTPTSDQIAFRDYLDELFAKHEDLNLHYFHSKASVGQEARADGAAVHNGRITAERVVEVMRGNYLRTPEGSASIPWFESDVYICGPVDFNDAIRAGLVAAGANPDLVRVEDFAAAAVSPTGPRRQEDAIVRYGSRQLEAKWAGEEEQTLLELAENHGLELPFDCRAGTCRTCESNLLCGEVDGPTTTTIDGTVRVLLCVSYPLSERVDVEPPR